MKILHICTGWPLSLQGGITNYVRSLAQTQYNSGIEVHVLGAKDSEEYNFHYEVFYSKIIPFSYTPLEDKESLKRINTYLETEQFDLIHIHALEYVDWDIYDVVKNYRYIVSLHDYCFICPRIYMFNTDYVACKKYDEAKCERCISYLDRFSLVRRIFAKLSQSVNKRIKVPHIRQDITKTRYTKFSNLLNHAEYILPVSKRVEEIYKASGIEAKSKVLHIGNISANGFNSNIVYNTDKKKLKFVFIGRLSKEKGVDVLINLADRFAHNDNIEFHFWGGVDKTLAKRIERHGIINHGRYEQRNLVEILKNYDMGLVLPVWEDNGPQVVMELLNNNIPVIGTKMGGIIDFVNFNNGFIFDPYSDDDIECLYSFIENLTPLKILSLKKNIRPTKTPEEHYKDLMEVYSEVLNC